jgi:hypothetical protein
VDYILLCIMYVRGLGSLVGIYVFIYTYKGYGLSKVR